ncbi:hypothetical protein EDF46_3545 [Frondihabitans sp. PhB188]|uniref:hypothetical protein n=1 Tax=Frondihabitans sp. PhB188 TaxID=2485200 RepID=UPI000FB65452|nr:hypothetical protein [Frondihabitans sp. PhB188]ROQ31032.1 hypothetical protein EDF46_3545 [Frondihabitans sp. PhB188]
MSDVGNVHSGEVEGELEGVLRTLVASAGRIGETIARGREEAARRAEAESTQRARELQAQYEQERVLARAQVQPVNEPAWWDRASADDIARAYETTAAWKDDDPNLAAVHAKMGDELRERYGLDVIDLGADPERVADVLHDREAAGEVTDGQGSTQEDRREADTLLNAADRHDQAAEAARSDADRSQGVGPNGEVGAGYVDPYPEPAPLDPNAERAITLTLNEYEAERIDNFLAASAFASRDLPDESDIDRDDGRSWDQIVTATRDTHDSSMGMRGRLAEARATAAQSTVGTEQAAGDKDRRAGLATWDSADRRDTHAEAMAAQRVDPIAIQAQYGADVSNAEHPRAAVASTRGAAKARKTTTRALGTRRERGDRSR